MNLSPRSSNTRPVTRIIKYFRFGIGLLIHHQLTNSPFIYIKNSTWQNSIFSIFTPSQNCYIYNREIWWPWVRLWYEYFQCIIRDGHIHANTIWYCTACTLCHKIAFINAKQQLRRHHFGHNYLCLILKFKENNLTLIGSLSQLLIVDGLLYQIQDFLS